MLRRYLPTSVSPHGPILVTLWKLGYLPKILHPYSLASVVIRSQGIRIISCGDDGVGFWVTCLAYQLTGAMTVGNSVGN